MGFVNNQSTAAATYRQTDIYGGVESASPHRLIEMLLDGLIKNLAHAKIGINCADAMQKCISIDKALNILDALRGGLNFESGGDLARNLDDLYDYLQRTLVTANLDSSVAKIEEVMSLIQVIRDTWSNIDVGEGNLSGGYSAP